MHSELRDPRRIQFAPGDHLGSVSVGEGRKKTIYPCKNCWISIGYRTGSILIACYRFCSNELRGPWHNGFRLFVEANRAADGSRFRFVRASLGTTSGMRTSCRSAEFPGYPGRLRWNITPCIAAPSVRATQREAYRAYSPTRLWLQHERREAVSGIGEIR